MLLRNAKDFSTVWKALSALPKNLNFLAIIFIFHVEVIIKNGKKNIFKLVLEMRSHSKKCKVLVSLLLKPAIESTLLDCISQSQ